MTNMKTFILIVLSTILFSCGEDLLITRTYKPTCYNDLFIENCINYYIVSKIEHQTDSLCIYHLTSDSRIDFDYNITFVDSIVKFEISEKLYVSFDKIK